MNKLVALFLSIILIWPLMVGAASNARSSRYGLTDAGSGGKLAPIDSGTPSQTLAVKIGGILGTALAFLGVIFLGLMIAGGLIWMTAGGNEKKLATARQLLVAAAIGLFIVLAAYAIATYVGNNLIAK